MMVRLTSQICFYFVATLLATASFCGYTQDVRLIEGRVVAKDGSPLPGVNVVAETTKVGIVTDAEGKFQLSASADEKLIFSFIGFKSKEVNASEIEKNTEVVLLEDVIYCGPGVSVGYGVFKQQEVPLAVSHLANSDFNQGVINDPALLWQGKLAGVSIYNRGGDPHVESFMRIRGMTSFDTNSKPLIVIDGVPAATLNNLDPNDVESISVLKDGAAAAIYGMRGSSGVIEVVTKRSSPVAGLFVTYQSQVSASLLQRTQPLLSRSEFIAAGGADAGSSTDWQDEITRTGISSVNAISISGSSSQTSFRGSLNFRNIDGILLHSGFDQVNGRFGVTHLALQDRLRIDFNLAFTNRESNVSFPEAFRYIYFNPTAPVRFPNNNFYQAILFDSYNPVALLELNRNEGKRKTNNFNIKSTYSISENVTATVHFAQQVDDRLNGTYYSRQDFTRGLNRGGLAQRYAEQSSFSLIESYLSYFKTFGKTEFRALMGYSYQQDRFENLNVELGNFPNDELGYNSLESAGDRLSGNPFLVNISSTANPVNKLSAFFARLNVNHNDLWSLNFSLRRETSNRLGLNSDAGVFSSAAVGINLNNLWSLNLNALKARISYGITGAIPSQPGVSQDQFQYQINNGGSILQTQKGNPNLRWEQKNEVNLGVDFGLGRVFGSLDLYKRTTKDIIQMGLVVDVQSYPQYQNIAGLKGRGIELNLNYTLGGFGSWQWTPGIVLSANRTVVNGFKDEFQFQNGLRGSIDGGGCACSGVIRWAEGERIGQFWAPIFGGVASNGSVILKDINADGRIEPLADYASAGYAMPSWELGWSNLLKYRHWDLNAFFRGAFGHSLINVPRLLHEPNNIGAINTWNQVRTNKAIASITSATYNSLYVEKANFLKLDNITLGYAFKTKPNLRLRIQAGVQNAFVITNYTGVDPEPIFVDGLRSAVYSVGASSLSPGIDRKGGYLPARTFTLGVTLGL